MKQYRANLIFSFALLFLSAACGDPPPADLNECELLTDNCGDNALCTNATGSFTCECKPGYSGDGVTCANVDECATGENNCSESGSCVDTPGAYTCLCNAGFEGDGVECSDLNECELLTDNCSDNALCTNAPGSFICACNAGYMGDGVTCANVDECTTGDDNCSENGSCVDTPGTFACLCNAGFEGDGVECTDINECALLIDNCSDNALCTNAPGSFSCACNSGYSGNGLGCANVDECTTDADNCDANAVCTDTAGSFSCECNSGYSGDGVTCTNIDECTTDDDDCDANALCTDTAGSFSCECNSGYSGDGVTCANIDECTTDDDNCDADALCTDTAGSFSCECNSGYSGDGVTCANIDECALDDDNCDINALCTDSPGGFSCECNGGYSGDGVTCANIDECATGGDNCDVNAVCTDSLGGFSCECIPGYGGDGTTCACNVGSAATECQWARLYALDGMNWVYRAQDAYLDLEHTQPVSDGDPVLSFKASGNNIPTVSDLDWTAGLDYTEQQLWYKNFGSRPVYFENGNGDEYVFFVNGMATNFETQPGQLVPREGKADFHLVQCFRSMPGSHYEGALGGGIAWKDRSGPSGSIQIKLSVGGNPWVHGPLNKVTLWGQDNIVEIKLYANGDAQFFLNEELLIDTNFPDLDGTGVMYEFGLGTNSHVMSNHFRAVMMKRDGHFSADEMAVIYETTDVLWPRGQFPAFPYLAGAWLNTASTWYTITKTWAPSTGTFSGGNTEEGTHLYQWYYWRSNDDLFQENSPLRAHLPIPGATGPSLTRTEYEAGNALGNPVIFDNPGDASVRVMRVVTPVDSAGTQGEPLAGNWAYDNIP